jgi:hypothetical protein
MTMKLLDTNSFVPLGMLVKYRISQWIRSKNSQPPDYARI